MEIRDVIGSIRGHMLDLQRQIHELKLAVHILEYRVSRETKEARDGEQPPLPIFDPAQAPAATEEGVVPPREWYSY